MTAYRVALTVNGKLRELLVEPHERLLDVLRERLGLYGTKEGCGEGECGTCTVLMDGKPVSSCLVLAIQADGHEVLTIEGLGRGAGLHPLQAAFIEDGAIQCGYCTPGMILAAKALLDRNSAPSEGEVRRAISGSLCRCTGYDKPVRAILDAARRMREEAR